MSQCNTVSLVKMKQYELIIDLMMLAVFITQAFSECYEAAVHRSSGASFGNTKSVTNTPRLQKIK